MSDHSPFCPAFTAPEVAGFRAVEATGPCNCGYVEHEVDVMYVPVCERCGKPAHYDDRDERWHHDGSSHSSVTAAH